jgi:hypothetical protein
VGDCNADDEVTVDELLQMVNIAVERLPLEVCEVGDLDRNGEITIDEILQAANHALFGC